MNVLVTGGAGFLGSHLVDALVGRGDNVTVVDNLHRGTLTNLQGHLDAGRVIALPHDIRDFGSLRRSIDGAEIVFHLAAQSNVMGAIQDPDYSFTTNVVGTFNVLKAAAETGVGRVVFASSREVYGEPESIPVPETAPLAPKGLYGASKMAGEAYCRAWRERGIECQVLRFANIYGPRDRERVIPLWAERASAGEPLVIYGGKQILDFVEVDLCVRALLAAAERPISEPINVGTGVATRLPDLARCIISLAGGRSAVEVRPAREAEVVQFVADVTRMKELLGIESGGRSLDGLKDMLPHRSNTP